MKNQAPILTILTPIRNFIKCSFYIHMIFKFYTPSLPLSSETARDHCSLLLIQGMKLKTGTKLNQQTFLFASWKLMKFASFNSYMPRPISLNWPKWPYIFFMTSSMIYESTVVCSFLIILRAFPGTILHVFLFFYRIKRRINNLRIELHTSSKPITHSSTQLVTEQSFVCTMTRVSKQNVHASYFNVRIWWERGNNKRPQWIFVICVL